MVNSVESRQLCELLDRVGNTFSKNRFPPTPEQMAVCRMQDDQAYLDLAKFVDTFFGYRMTGQGKFLELKHPLRNYKGLEIRYLWDRLRQLTFDCMRSIYEEFPDEDRPDIERTFFVPRHIRTWPLYEGYKSGTIQPRSESLESQILEMYQRVETQKGNAQ